MFSIISIVLTCFTTPLQIAHICLATIAFDSDIIFSKLHNNFYILYIMMMMNSSVYDCFNDAHFMLYVLLYAYIGTKYSMLLAVVLLPTLFLKSARASFFTPADFCRAAD